MELDESLRRMMRDLGHALSRAISDSSEVSLVLRRMRQEGYSLYLLIKEEEDAEPIELRPKEASRGEPVFKIDGRDVTFLKSIGIDPTRRLRRRRSL